MMVKIGLLMSGQGSEAVGMGNDLYQDYPIYHDTIDQASQLTQLDLQKIMNDADLLGQTRYAQPAIVAMSVGISRMLTDAGVSTAGALGLSLGEYSALIASGMLDLTTGLPLVAKRGALMQATVEAHPGAMIAILKPDINQIQAACETIQKTGETVAIANYNSPKQIVVGGTQSGIQALTTLFETLEVAPKVIPLPVKGAFHTALFEETAYQFEQALAQITFKEGVYPVISNTTEQPFEVTSLQATLTAQMYQPTHFATGLTQLAKQEVTTVIEVGPGNALSKFARQTVPQLDRFNISSSAQFETVVAALKEGAH
ncbi:ACP S-malonyltransferase [Latilactobacillus sakei]|uniref:Malonyl CoA-acyl carrier protein transacylase n=1 Tax=Latilactobacillus sakei TaxID=1599 RepID=A0AAF0GPB9_LATSK|nr:ACP S-malonyltransferase [Latilactobacillus sakei]WGI20050.1 ACP S-malonyltransferase [Latilactobacillus sakei]